MSSQPRTNILEPVTHSNKKTTFRVPSADRVIYSSLRLCDFGLSAVAGATGQENFAFASGAYALLKNVRLYAGNTLIDQCLDVDRIMGHHMLRGSTMEKFDVDQKLVCNSLNIREVVTDPVNGDETTSLQPLANKLLARIKLDDVLLLLKSVEYFAGWAGDLKLELEYNTDATVVLSSSGSQGAMTVSRPILVFEDEMNEEVSMVLMKEQAGRFSAVWNTYEREYISGIVAGLNGIRVRGFDNKMVNHLLLAVGYTNGGVEANLGHGYSLELGEKVNFLVNGVRLLPLTGMDTSARRAGSVSDQSVLGLCVPTGCHDSTTLGPNDQSDFSDALFALFGKISWSAYEINNIINRLDLEFTLPANYEPTNSAYIWASVMKFLTKDASGNIIVGYQAIPESKLE